VELRWAVYNQVKALRFSRPDEHWAPLVASLTERVNQLSTWPSEQPCPRWRVIEAWASAAHGPVMAAAGAPRLALWREAAPHHGPRLQRALARYERYSAARPPGWPTGPTAALARFLAQHLTPQDGPEHGLAYDVARFDQLTKHMSAYAHYQRGQQHLALMAKRAARRAHARELAQQINQRLGFRLGELGPAARLQTARQLLDSQHPAHRAAARTLHAGAQRHQRLQQRDQRLLAGRHPGDADGRYQAAYRYAQQWGLPLPAGRREGTAA
jgi:hypothetical protein